MRAKADPRNEIPSPHAEVFTKKNLPVWGDCRLVTREFGLHKSTIYRYINDGTFTSVTTKDEGASRGKRLIEIASVIRFFDSRATRDSVPADLSARSGLIHAAEVLPAVLDNFYQELKQTNPELAEAFATSARESGLGGRS